MNTKLQRWKARFCAPAPNLLLAQAGIALVACLCVFLISTNLHHASTSREHSIESTRIALTTARQAVAEQAGNVFHLGDNIAADIARELESDRPAAERLSRSTTIAATYAAAAAAVKNVIVLDAQAHPLFAFKSTPDWPGKYGAREYFQFHRDQAQHALHISHPVRAFSDRKWAVPISRRIEHADGTFAGVVVVLIDVDYLERFYSTLIPRTTGAIGLYLEDGTLLASNGAAAGANGVARLSLRQAPEILAGAAGATAGTGSGEAQGQLYTTSRIDRYSPIVVVSTSVDAALTPWKTARNVSVTSAFIITVLLCTLAVILVAQIRSRRDVEGALLQYEMQSRLMIDSLEDYGIYMLDKEGLVVTWNVGAERLTGFSAGDAIGTEGTFFCTAPDRVDGRHREILAYAKAHGREENEGWRVRKDGSRFWVHAVTTPLFDRDGGHSGYMKVLRDITGSKQIAEALEASEFRWKFALEGAGEGVWDINDQTGEIDVSHQYLAMLGYEEGDVPNHMAFWRQAVHPDDLPRIMTAVREHRAGRAPNYSCEYRVRCKDGTYKWVLSRGMVVSRDASGKVLRLIGTQNDISHLKSIEQRLSEQNALIMEKNAQLEQSSRVKSEFLANMSHELRTPLNAVLGFTGTLLMELPGPLNAQQKHQLETVRDSGRHLLALINEILNLSKIETGGAEIALGRVRCQDLIADVTESLMPLASQKHIAIEVVLPTQPIEVMSDPRLVKQILINLVGNAIKFTETGSVQVLLYHADNLSGSVCIDVTDSGIGIRPEDMGKLFLPFSQIEAGLSRRFDGTGLGLNVSKKYADLIGVSLQVDSTYGQGSTFSIRIPSSLVCHGNAPGLPAPEAHGMLHT